jgi:hypothetical protein
MPRYFFDIRDGDEVYFDEEGLDLPDLRAAEVEAAESLAHMARDKLPTKGDRHQMAIEVRTPDGPLFRAAFIFEIHRNTH